MVERVSFVTSFPKN